jgi:3-oxoacyl-[acyl-carrier-protein] synthase II
MTVSTEATGSEPAGETARRRVLVTGLGTVTPFGNDTGQFWARILAGDSAISRIERFDVSGYPVQIAAEIKNFDPDDFMERRDWRMMDRFIQYATAASLLAWDDAQLAGVAPAPDRVGVAIGTGVGGQESFQDHNRMLTENGARSMPPYHLPMFLPNMATARVSIRLKAEGPTTTVATACAASAHSIGDAFRFIQRGEADVMVAGGTEAPLHPMGLGGFCAARALSTRNDEPTRASRPFDRARDGFVLGEGAAMVLLEEREHALARGARVYAELVGYAATSDAYNTTMPAPDGAGAARCMRRALHDAGLKTGDIDYINTHGTATKLGDRSETRAVKAVFGDYAGRVACSSTKSMTGHLLGASGALEAVICALAVHTGRLPPTINLDDPDEECDLDYVAGSSRQAPVGAALSNSFAFGGHNVSLVFARHRTPHADTEKVTA